MNPMQSGGTKAFVADLVLGRGVVSVKQPPHCDLWKLNLGPEDLFASKDRLIFSRHSGCATVLDPSCKR